MVKAGPAISIYGPTTGDQLLRQHAALTEHALNVMRAKNHDYTGSDSGANDALANFRHASNLNLCSLPQSVLIRLTDKISRLATFTKGDVKVKDESLMDTVVDAINYLVIFYAASIEGREQPRDPSA